MKTICGVLLLAMFSLFDATGSAVAASDPAGDLSTPQKCWHAFLRAAQSGAQEEVRKVTTPRGIASLTAGVDTRDQVTTLARRARGWQAWAIRWGHQDAARAEALLGPEIKEHGLSFIKTPSGWKLDEWRAGE